MIPFTSTIHSFSLCTNDGRGLHSFRLTHPWAFKTNCLNQRDILIRSVSAGWLTYP